MRLTTLTLCCILFLSGCGTVSQLHSMLSEKSKRDAENALSIALKSGGDPAIERCTEVKLDAIAKAPDPTLVTGKLSGIAALRAVKRLREEVDVACAEVRVQLGRWKEMAEALFGRGLPF